MSQARKRLYIQEVATRDGFQNEARFVDTEARNTLAALDARGGGRRHSQAARFLATRSLICR